MNRRCLLFVVVVIGRGPAARILALFANLSKPRLKVLHGADVLGFAAAGICFGV
jgi:hypothetical protein